MRSRSSSAGRVTRTFIRMTTIKRSQFVVGHEFTAPRGVHTLAHGGSLLLGQPEYAITPALDFVHGFLDLAKQFVRQGGDAFEKILQLRVHKECITCRDSEFHLRRREVIASGIRGYFSVDREDIVR